MEKSKKEYNSLLKRNLIVIFSLLVALLILIPVSLFVGQAKLSFLDSLKGIFGAGSNANVRIIRYIRLPRILAAVVVGFGLAISGCTLQSVLQNPLASPSSLGVSQSAVFGANLAIVFGAGAFSQGNTLNVNNPYVVAVIAFVFSFATVLAVVGISKFKNFAPVTVILLGVAATSLFTALTTLTQYLASDQVLSAAVYWSFGDLSRASYQKIAIMAACIVPSFVVFFLFRWKFNAINSGDEIASSLGVSLNITRMLALILSSLITAVCVSFVGVIGFVGIICPQLLKRFIGADMRFLLPASGLCGALLLVVSDMLARIVVSGMNLPVGAVTAIIGAPVFVYILLRKEKGYGVA
ncbi:MAG: iron ABC transporter permease [Clostridia bacterium]|nr:iron ABC transporter permease [Clostridia bacterium]